FCCHWPVACGSANDCQDPPEYWTIHGLWPDKTEECNRTWHFNVTEIKDLMSDMRHYWPDVLHSSLNRTQFWKHEWEKHGTCAATLQVLNSQRKYFGKALELYQHVDLNSDLLIYISFLIFQMTAIKEALTRFYGVMPKIQCLPPEEVKIPNKHTLPKSFKTENQTKNQQLFFFFKAAVENVVCRDGVLERKIRSSYLNQKCL
uniref:Uncharacterized protein n=1 Tax=Strix occidentalis caurina TaxID=311401 RepID=A0A8D0F7P3_STROC